MEYAYAKGIGREQTVQENIKEGNSSGRKSEQILEKKCSIYELNEAFRKWNLNKFYQKQE